MSGVSLIPLPFWKGKHLGGKEDQTKALFPTLELSSAINQYHHE